MPNNRLTILAINPGTRYIGIAVLRGAVLIEWSVKVVAGPLSQTKRKKIAKLIDRLISEYEPDIIVTKRLHPSRASQVLNRICRDIEAAAIADGIMSERYSIQEVEQFFAPGERMNKIHLAELVCKQHPVLHNELNRERDNCNPYYVRMFEAVALGTMVQLIASKTTECQLVFCLSDKV